MGFKIFRHAFLLFVQNFLPAIKVSLVPGIILFIVIAAFAPRNLELTSIINPKSFPLLPILFIVFMMTVLTAEMVISWHRFVLLSEQPVWFSGFNLTIIFKYIWVSILRSIIVILVGAVAGAILLSLIKTGQAIANFGVFVLTTYIWLRIGLSLPAIAIGKTLTLEQSWTRTAQINAEIFAVSFFMAVFPTFISIFASVFTGLTYIFVLIITQWAQMMIGASVLTTLYGYLIEKRRLF